MSPDSAARPQSTQHRTAGRPWPQQAVHAGHELPLLPQAVRGQRRQAEVGCELPLHRGPGGQHLEAAGRGPIFFSNLRRFAPKTAQPIPWRCETNPPLEVFRIKMPPGVHLESFITDMETTYHPQGISIKKKLGKLLSMDKKFPINRLCGNINIAFVLIPDVAPLKNIHSIFLSGATSGISTKALGAFWRRGALETGVDAHRLLIHRIDSALLVGVGVAGFERGPPRPRIRSSRPSHPRPTRTTRFSLGGIAGINNQNVGQLSKPNNHRLSAGHQLSNNGRGRPVVEKKGQAEGRGFPTSRAEEGVASLLCGGGGVSPPSLPCTPSSHRTLGWSLQWSGGNLK